MAIFVLCNIGFFYNAPSMLSYVLHMYLWLLPGLSVSISRFLSYCMLTTILVMATTLFNWSLISADDYKGVAFWLLILIVFTWKHKSIWNDFMGSFHTTYTTVLTISFYELWIQCRQFLFDEVSQNEIHIPYIAPQSKKITTVWIF